MSTAASLNLEQSQNGVLGNGLMCFQHFSYIAAASVLTLFPGVHFTNTSHNILSKPLAAFPHNHCRNNGQERSRLFINYMISFVTC